MSEGAKAVRLVVTRPLQQLRNSFPRFLPGGGSSTTARPKPRPQKQVLDLSEVHYHYDDFGNRIENPKEYLKQFKQSVSHSHSHIGDASTLPENVLKELEMKEELKFEKDVDDGTAFSSSFDWPQHNSFKSSFHNNQFNSFGGFDTSSTVTHNENKQNHNNHNDWAPVQKAKPASSLHTNIGSFGKENSFGSSSKFLNNHKINTFRSVKHYDSDRPSSSYSFHHFASPNVDYGFDTKEKEGLNFGSQGSSSNKVSKTQNFEQFYDYYDNKRKDHHHASESQILPMMDEEEAPEAAPLVQKAPITTTTTTTSTTTTTTQRPTTKHTTHKPTTTRARAAPKQHQPSQHQHHHDREQVNVNTERPNYPEYFFAKPKGEAPKQKFIPVRNVRDEEDLFKGAFTPPARFVPQAPKFPTYAKEPVHIVMAQPVHDVPSLKAKEKFRKQVEQQVEKRPQGTPSFRKRYPTVRPQKLEHAPVTTTTTLATTTTTTSAPSPMPTLALNHHVSSYTEGYTQNEVQSERKFPKKYQSYETTTLKPRPKKVHETPRPTSAPYNRGAVRARGSVKFGARL